MKKLFGVLLVCYVLLYIVPLGVRPMIFPDEFRYAEISREILQRGNWVVPHLDGLRYFEKPALGYWLNSMAMAIFGENAFAVRICSALAAGLSGLILLLLVKMRGGGRHMGLLAAAIFLGCWEVFFIGTFSVLDSMFSLFVTATITLFFLAYTENSHRKRVVLLTFCGVACGLAFLTKGFLAFALPGVTVVGFLLWQRRTNRLLRYAWIPVTSAIIVALPWSLMIHLRESDFWHYFFWVQHVQRLVGADGGQHPEPFWFFIPFILGGAFPWLFAMPAAIAGLKQVRFKDPLLRLALCWLVLPFLLLSVSSGKLGTYIIPCFVPLAILIGAGLGKYFAEGSKKTFTLYVWVLGAIMAALTALLVINQIGPVETRHYGRYETWKAVLAIMGLSTYVIFLIAAARAQNPWRKVFYFAVGPVLFLFLVFFVAPQKALENKAPGKFLSQYADKVGPRVSIVSDNYMIASVCWVYKRSDVFVLDRPGELAYGFSYDDSKDRLLDMEGLNGLIAGKTAEKAVVLITSRKRYCEYKSRLPEPIFEDSDNDFVFAEFKATHRNAEP